HRNPALAVDRPSIFSARSLSNHCIGMAAAIGARRYVEQDRGNIARDAGKTRDYESTKKTADFISIRKREIVHDAQALLTIHAEKSLRKCLNPSMCLIGNWYFASASSSVFSKHRSQT